MSTIVIGGRNIAVHQFGAVVVGSGAAGLCAANRLFQFGMTDICIITDAIKGGTSRNTGSDKQTYYKLTLSGSEPDSVRQMAQTFFDGQCMDGDHALCEAALSAKGFLNLCELGVPFPTNRYGEYIGYKTDHDPARRATSAGPLTSKLMTEALERAILTKDIRIMDGYQVVRILTENGRAQGLLCLRDDHQFALIRCAYIIYATGGPAGIYMDSCYPLCHTGSSGAAFEAGALGKNLTEWQYGLASVEPRWNVSGTFMQVLPRFVSIGDNGDEREFLPDYIDDPGKLLDCVFLKGYQWPFDVRKLSGSSLIDLIVYHETKIKGRKVYLDFTRNPLGADFDFALLGDEARSYLEKAKALFGAPIERLQHMNAPAIEFYRSRGVDLATDRLEIALCSQHQNGGLSVDAHWQTHVQGLYAVGEAAGTHGVYRPGGSALNAGQVGAARAAEHIADLGAQPIDDMSATLMHDIDRAIQIATTAQSGASNLCAMITDSTFKMSKAAAAVRDNAAVLSLYDEVCALLNAFNARVTIADETEWALLYRYRDLLISQKMVLLSMLDYADHGGKSRGAALYTDAAGEVPLPSLPETCRYVSDDGKLSGMVQEVSIAGECVWRPVRPIPEDDDFFENVWREYRERKQV